MSEVPICVSGYEDLANEYYDAEAHPNSAGFRVLSAAILNRLWPDTPTIGLTLEVGAGRSVVLEERRLLDRLGSAPLVVTDRNVSMLRHSLPITRRSTWPVLCDAAAVPLTDRSTDLVISSLGDPYLSSEFLAEASRVLRPGGAMLYTTPSWEWAEWYRATSSAETPGLAHFETANGARHVRSQILPTPNLLEELDAHGVKPEVVIEADRASLPVSLNAPKLSPFHGPLVTGVRGIRVV